MIHAMAEALDDRQGQQRSKSAVKTIFILLLQKISHHLGHAFRGLEHDVADKAVTHDDVGRTFVNVGALDIAIKIKVAGSQKFARRFDAFIALDVFRADVQQANGWILLAFHRSAQHGTHDGKLKEVFGCACCVRAEIECVNDTMARRQRCADGRPVNPRQCFEYKFGSTH